MGVPPSGFGGQPLGYGSSMISMRPPLPSLSLTGLLVDLSGLLPLRWPTGRASPGSTPLKGVVTTEPPIPGGVRR